MKPKILLVEDEEAIATMLKYNLEQNDCEVLTCEDGEEALLMIEEEKPDLVILDWMIPSMSGVEVCTKMRQRSDMAGIPVIMLTARGEEADRVRGLDSGADDYVVKPFSPKELIARMHAILRRTRPVLEEKKLEYGGLVMDIDAHNCYFKDAAINLGPTEYRLLAHFMEHPGRVYTRDQLIDAVWGMDTYIDDRTVDVHIKRLRKALSDTKAGLDGFVQTIRGTGYKFEEPA